jgi:hypothetical protein
MHGKKKKPALMAGFFVSEFVPSSVTGTMSASLADRLHAVLN